MFVRQRCVDRLRILLGVALVAAGVGLFALLPRTALAHHAELAVAGDCAGWTASAEYVGGDQDRKVVVDVWINDLHVVEEFYFDNEPGHLGHQDYWTLFAYSGSGSVWVQGTVTLWMRGGGGTYSALDNTATIDTRMVCATPTNTPTTLPTSTPPPPTETLTPTSTATEAATATPATTDTPAATPTTGTQGTITPLPTDTPATGTATPETATTATPTTGHSPTPQATTPQDDDAPASPTLVTTVEALRPPTAPDEPATSEFPPAETASGLPDTGDGAGGVQGIVVGLTAAMLAAVGLAVIATGMRRSVR